MTRSPTKMDNTPINKLKCLPKEFDPRSPTFDFDRTPIMIIESPNSASSSCSQDVSFKSLLDASYDSFDISRDDPSPIVSSLSLDIETSYNVDMDCEKEKQTAEKLIPEDTKMTIDNEPTIPSPVPQETEQPITQQASPAKLIPTPKEESAALAAKKIIFSPSMAVSSPQKRNASFTCHMDCDNDQENAQQPMKVRSPRTPLAMLSNQSNSPINILRAKQWKDMKEEREKLGLVKSENALPPFKVTPSSVPAKIPARRRPLV